MWASMYTDKGIGVVVWASMYTDKVIGVVVLCGRVCTLIRV